MKARPVIMVVMFGLLLTLLGQSVFAFSDTAGDPNEDKINALRDQGVLKGMEDDLFRPEGNLSYAEGISLIVKGLDLNTDNMRFVRKPQVSDYFANLKDEAWYADAFIAAHYNGLDIPGDVKADAVMTREQYAHNLLQAMIAKGEFAFIEMYVMLTDEKDVDPAYMDSVQKLLVSNVVKLDESGKFYPKNPITRSEAAGWLYDVMQQVKSLTPVVTLPEENAMPLSDIALQVTKVNEEINKVTVSAQAPHPGYGIRISSISFEGDQAWIHVEAVQPDPDKMYPQVITEVHADAYVSSGFKPELANSGDTASPGFSGGGDDAVQSGGLTQ
ncbi:S-layer homology domain-containing protein [Paenibacillus thailandensis]|uniref:S-layer homology domain-containing protein n=1 Tax=Paenibacillus thailandensis TaxID=393250 RepID=A0ABW5QYN9_9BACL